MAELEGIGSAATAAVPSVGGGIEGSMGGGIGSAVAGGMENLGGGNAIETNGLGNINAGLSPEISSLATGLEAKIDVPDVTQLDTNAVIGEVAGLDVNTISSDGVKPQDGVATEIPELPTAPVMEGETGEKIVTGTEPPTTEIPEAGPITSERAIEGETVAPTEDTAATSQTNQTATEKAAEKGTKGFLEFTAGKLKGAMPGRKESGSTGKNTGSEKPESAAQPNTAAKVGTPEVQTPNTTVESPATGTTEKTGEQAQEKLSKEDADKERAETTTRFLDKDPNKSIGAEEYFRRKQDIQRREGKVERRRELDKKFQDQQEKGIQMSPEDRNELAQMTIDNPMGFPEEITPEQAQTAAAQAEQSGQSMADAAHVSETETIATEPKAGTLDTQADVLKGIGKAVVEARKAKVNEYRERILAVRKGGELHKGDAASEAQLLHDYQYMGGNLEDLNNPSTATSTEPGATVEQKRPDTTTAAGQTESSAPTAQPAETVTPEQAAAKPPTAEEAQKATRTKELEEKVKTGKATTEEITELRGLKQDPEKRQKELSQKALDGTITDAEAKELGNLNTNKEKLTPEQQAKKLQEDINKLGMDIAAKIAKGEKVDPKDFARFQELKGQEMMNKLGIDPDIARGILQKALQGKAMGSEKQSQIMKEAQEEIQELMSLEMQLMSIPESLKAFREQRKILIQKARGKHDEANRTTGKERLQKKGEEYQAYMQVANISSRITAVKYAVPRIEARRSQLEASVRAKLGITSGFGMVMEWAGAECKNIVTEVGIGIDEKVSGITGNI